MGTKIVVFGEMSSGLMKEKYNCLAIMTIVMFGGLQAEEHHPIHEAWGWHHHVVDGALLQERLVHFTK